MLKKKPNIILINCDDMGYGDLGCYGSEINHTPFIDSMAKEGVKLTSCYASSPVCSPSRACLMTGSYPTRVSINRVLFPGVPYGLNPEEYTMANLFAGNGYKSMIVGKWHCGDQKEFLPMNYGFDGYYGLPYSNDMGMQAGREDNKNFPPLPLIEDNEVIQEQPDQRSLTERYVEQCTRFIRKNRKNPFFLYFAQMHVHLPLYANNRFEKESENGDFGACMAEVDWACQAIVEELKRLNLYENTCIIFTSDNGSKAANGASNGALKGSKFYTWEGGMRVPCIFHWKGILPENVEVNHICGQIDFLPLFAHMIGAQLPKDVLIDGMDIYDSIFYNQPVRNQFVYYGANRAGDETGFLCAIRNGKWKMHYQLICRDQPGMAYYEKKKELYDLETDIGETNNLYDAYPELVEEFDLLFQKYKNLLGDQGSNVIGSEIRPCGIVENPVTLTVYDESHPYIVAIYDKDDVG